MTTPTTEPDRDREITEVLTHHGKARAAAVVAHLSVLGSDSVIGLRDADGVLTPAIEFLPLPMRGADLLDDVGRIDENAPRLVANYRKAFPEATDRLLAFGAELDDVETPALGWLLLACGLVLSFDDGDLAAAHRTGGGLKVDTVVIDRSGRYLFDGRRLLRSLMSYRIADAPVALLANSVFESLGDFVADTIGRMLREQATDLVVCAGDLLAGNPTLRGRVRSGLARARLPVLFPEFHPPASEGVLAT